MSDTPASARTARSRYRQAESSVARLRLLSDSAAVLAEQGRRPSALGAVLSKVLAFLALEDGLLLASQDDALHVCAAQGPVHPIGARLSYDRVLQGALQRAPQVRQDVASALRVGREQRAGLEVLVPLVYDGKGRGLLALLSARPAPAPDAEDLETLQALATLLGAALATAQPSTARSAAADSSAVLRQLTPRELQVFKLLPGGLTNAEIAHQLGIAPGTVKIHVERILAKLDLHDRTQAAVRAADCGLGA
ncbi:response regulator transcription factor [Oxalobacteraceae bacterium A2-2]